MPKRKTRKKRRIRRFFQEHRWVAIVLGTVVVLAVTALIFRGAIAEALRGWRSGRILAKAERHADAGQWGESLRLAYASAQLKPSLDAVRIQFRALKETSHPQILVVARTLALHDEATPEDVAEGLGTFIDVGDFVMGQAIIDDLDEETKASPEARSEFVRFLLAKNRFDDAVQVTSTLEAPQWKNRANLALARSFLGSEDTAIQANGGVRVLEVLKSERKEDALEAFRIIAALDPGRLEEGLAKAAVDRFSSDDLSEARDRLDLAYLKWWLTKPAGGKPTRVAATSHHPLFHPERAAGLLYLHWILGQDAREKIAWETMSVYHAEHLELLARWLLKAGYPRDVVELTGGPDVQSLRSPELFLARANGLARARLIPTLAEELTQPPKGIPPIDALAFQAAAARFAGKEGEEMAFWQKAFEQADGAGKTTNSFYRLANLARRFGAGDWELRAMAKAVDHPLGIPPLARDLVPVFQWLAREDPERLLSVSRRLLAREPANPVLINNVCYLSCIYEDPDPERTLLLSELVDEYPRLAGFRGSLALSQFLLGDFESARKTLEAMGVTPEAMDDPKRAICAAILYAEGKVDDADVVAGIIRWESLSKAEAEFFRNLLERVKSDAEKRAIFQKMIPPAPGASAAETESPSGPAQKTPPPP